MTFAGAITSTTAFAQQAIVQVPMMIKPLPPMPVTTLQKCVVRLLGCLGAASLQFLPLGAVAAPPVFNDVDVLVQDDDSVIRNLLSRNVLSGTQPMVIVSAINPET